MTILQALDQYYDRMAARGQAEPPGYSREKISFAIELSESGEPLAARDLREKSGKRTVPRLVSVPAAVKRTVGVAPNLLWDKTAYVLGRTAGEGKRTAQEHEAFKTLHLELLATTDDPGLLALRRFLESWEPGRFDAPPFVADMLDTNVVFRLDGDQDFIHRREAARRLLAERGATNEVGVPCLVTGRVAPVQRLHPTIKGVNGAQTSGAALVSFNLDAFTSYGKAQGDNAPTSELAAFRYGAALNAMLERESRNRLKRGIGDATVVFWADTAEVGEEAADAAEDFFAQALEPPDDAGQAKTIRDALDVVAAGRAVAEVTPKLHEKTRFHVLGLAPNAARLSVRYWMSDDFGAFAVRLGRHYEALRIAPVPRGWTMPSVNLLLARTTAPQGKFENIPPLLAGEVTRSILTGAPYPRALLAAAINRLRAGDDPTAGWHAAVIKACLNDHLSEEEKLPVALDRDNESAAYQLGRLFAVLESAQFAALGQVNATIGDRYYAAASATPARVFGSLLRGLKNHVSDARKRGQGGWIEPKVAEIMAKLPPELPRTLKLEDQGRFAVGYYHEKGARWAKGADAAEAKEGDEQ